MKKMRILLVSPLPPPTGGITTWTSEYLKEMCARDYEVSIVNSSVIGNRISVNSRINYFDELKRIIHIRSGIKKVIKTGAVDVIHYNASCFTAGLLRDALVLRGIKKQVPIVYQCHCNLETNIHSRLATFLFKLVLKSVNRVLVLNKLSQEFACQLYPSVEKVPNFISDAIIKDKECTADFKNIIFVGRVDERKGIAELLAAFKEKPALNLHIVGPDSSGYLKDVCESNIIKHGELSHDKTIEIMRDMDALILPSYSEGFPLVILEAMAVGLPVIATDVGSVKEMIEDKGGVLIRPRQVGDIVEAIKSIYPIEVRTKMSKFNIRKVKECYTCSCVLNRLVEIYEQAIGEKRK